MDLYDGWGTRRQVDQPTRRGHDGLDKLRRKIIPYAAVEGIVCETGSWWGTNFRR